MCCYVLAELIVGRWQKSWVRSNLPTCCWLNISRPWADVPVTVENWSSLAHRLIVAWWTACHRLTVARLSVTRWSALNTQSVIGRKLSKSVHDVARLFHLIFWKRIHNRPICCWTPTNSENLLKIGPLDSAIWGPEVNDEKIGLIKNTGKMSTKYIAHPASLPIAGASIPMRQGDMSPQYLWRGDIHGNVPPIF